MTLEAWDCLFGFPTNETRTADILAAMAGRRLLGDGLVVNWDKRQPKRERVDNTSADRQATFKAKAKQVTPSNAKENQVTPDNTKKHLEESRGEKSREDTHSSYLAPVDKSRPHESEAVESVCVFLESQEITGFSRGDAGLPDLVDRGAGLDVFTAAVAVARAKGKTEWPFVLGVVRRKLEDAANVVAGLPRGVPAVAVVPITVPGRAVARITLPVGWCSFCRALQPLEHPQGMLYLQQPLKREHCELSPANH